EAWLRRQVRLRVDGGMKFARDVIIAASLGADEFGFGTSALLAIGCVMARQCHLNTCPVGIATQDEKLRARFTGKPEMVMAYFQALASEVRSLLGRLGAATLGEIVGRAEYLRPRNPENSGWVEDLLRPVAACANGGRSTRAGKKLAHQITAVAVATGGSIQCKFPIMNRDRSVGAHLSGELVRQSGITGEAPLVDFEFQGAAGQSFGAFLGLGVRLRLRGDAQQFLCERLGGGGPPR